MSGNPFHPLGAWRLIENPSLTVGPFEDWSQVRSHGRAARRRRQGHPQRIRLYYLPDPKIYYFDNSLVAHPATMAGVRHVLERETAEYGAPRHSKSMLLESNPPPRPHWPRQLYSLRNGPGA